MAYTMPRISSAVLLLFWAALIGCLPYARSLSNITCFTCNNCPAVTSETNRTFCSELPFCITTFTNDGAIHRGCGKPDASFQDGCRNHSNAITKDSGLVCGCDSNLCNSNTTRLQSYVRSNLTALPTRSTISPSLQVEPIFLYQNSDNNRFPNESVFTTQPHSVDKPDVLEQDNISKHIYEEAVENYPDKDDKSGHNSSQNNQHTRSSHDFTEAEIKAVLSGVVHVVLKCVFGVRGFMLLIAVIVFDIFTHAPRRVHRVYVYIAQPLPLGHNAHPPPTGYIQLDCTNLQPPPAYNPDRGGNI